MVAVAEGDLAGVKQIEAGARSAARRRAVGPRRRRRHRPVAGRGVPGRPPRPRAGRRHRGGARPPRPDGPVATRPAAVVARLPVGERRRRRARPRPSTRPRPTRLGPRTRRSRWPSGTRACARRSRSGSTRRPASARRSSWSTRSSGSAIRSLVSYGHVAAQAARRARPALRRVPRRAAGLRGSGASRAISGPSSCSSRRWTPRSPSPPAPSPRSTPPAGRCTSGCRAPRWSRPPPCGSCSSCSSSASAGRGPRWEPVLRQVAAAPPTPTSRSSPAGLLELGDHDAAAAALAPFLARLGDLPRDWAHDALVALAAEVVSDLELGRPARPTRSTTRSSPRRARW